MSERDIPTTVEGVEKAENYVRVLGIMREQCESHPQWPKRANGTPLDNDIPVRCANVACSMLNAKDATIAELRAESSSMQATVRKLTDIAEQQSAELTQLREDRRVLNTEATFARKLFEAAEREAGDDRSMQTQREYDLAYTAYMAVRKDTDSSGAIGRAT